MKLTATERKYLRMALESAIQWEDSLADAHHTAYPKGYTGIERKVVPPEWRSVVARCHRRINAYRKLIERTRGKNT